MPDTSTKSSSSGKERRKEKKRVRIGKVEAREAEASSSAPSGPPRLLLVSSRARGAGAMSRALRPNVHMVEYAYESSSLDGILGLVAEALGAVKVEAVGLVVHGSASEAFLCAQGQGRLSLRNVLETASVRHFFDALITNHLDLDFVNARLDFLAAPFAESVEGGLVAGALEELRPGRLSVGASPDLQGTGVPLVRLGEDEEVPSVGALYFNLQHLSPAAKVHTKLAASTARGGYEKIRVVGKGAFGSAVLYRRKDDGSLVVIKEIDMHSLSAQERTLALNEVAVLSRLHHPNIVSYFDSFEDDGVLMIEMEFADGGNLSQVLSRAERQLEEREVLELFQQIVSAVRYLHENNVLHRDLKTANIFLTKERCIKVGDFGISKVMGTSTQRRGAETVVGTPYYISPEMCEGKPYGEKSDVWALGCVLYEMAALQRTFEGSNLPALVNKIMKGQYEALRGPYSTELKLLIGKLLSMDPANRPSAADLLTSHLPQLLAPFQGLTGDEDEEGGQKRRARSVIYRFSPATASIAPLPGLPPRIRIRQVAASASHFLLCTQDKLVLAWGRNDAGALGLEDRQSRHVPTVVPSLTGKAIVKVAAGRGFSVFCSENGIVMTCGRKECTGQGPGADDLLKPRLVDSLLSVDMVSVACGDSHTVGVERAGGAWAWGCGGDGRLGTGLEQSEASPVQLRLAPGVSARLARASADASAILADSGAVLAFGSNKHNKLNLNKRQGALSQLKLSRSEVERVLAPTPMRPLGSRVVDISLGPDHGAVLLESGHVYLFGCNDSGQLGDGRTSAAASSSTFKASSSEPTLLKALADKVCVIVECGEKNSMALSSDGGLYFWGSRQERESSVVSQGDVRVEAGTGRQVGVVRPFVPEAEEDAELGIQSGAPEGRGDWIDTSLPTARTAKLFRRTADKDEESAEGRPSLVLRLEEGGVHGASIALAGVVASPSDLLLHVETNAPLPRKPDDPQRPRPTKGTHVQKLAQQATLDDLEDANDDAAANPAADSRVQTWIRRELADADQPKESTIPKAKGSKDGRKFRRKSLPGREEQAEPVGRERVAELEETAARLKAQTEAAAEDKAALEEEIQRLQKSLQDSQLSQTAPPETEVTEAALAEADLPQPPRSRMCLVM